MPTARLGDAFTIILQATKDGAIQNISAFTTIREIICRRPGGARGSFTLTAAFTSDGTDGLYEASTSPGQLNVVGDWQIFGHLSDGTTNVRSAPQTLTVESAPT